MTVTGNNGDTVKIFCAELVNADGTANQKATGSPSYFTYILKGGKEESWQPRFSYTGFRYMEVHCVSKDGSNQAPIVKNIEGLHIRNAADNVGSFTSSNDLFNKTNELIDWLDEEVQFNFTNTGKWNQFTINTGNMINAGNYTVRLIITGADGLAISGIDIQ